MDPENKRLYRWLPWFIAVVVTGLFFILLRSELLRNHTDWEGKLQFEQLGAQASLRVSQQELIRQAGLLAQLVAQDPAVLNLIRQARRVHEEEGGSGGSAQSAVLRKQLNQVLQPYWMRMSSLGVRELNVHIGPKVTAFLRVHNPDRFGDDMSQSSVLLVSVFKSGALSSGMEIGHFGANFRAMAPVFASERLDDVIPIGVVEVGYSLLPPHDGQPDQGQAVFLHTSGVSDLLWGTARQEVLANSGNIRTKWALEEFNDPLIKTWQINGLLPDLLDLQERPWILHDQGKSYLISVTSQSSFAAAHSPMVAPKVMIVNWMNITEQIARHEADRQRVLAKYGLEWLFAELGMLMLFRLNRRHITQLLREYNQQLQAERDSSEQSRHRLNLALVSSESGFWEWNIATNESYFSKEWRELCGLSADPEGRTDIEDWMERVHPSDKRASYNDMIRHIKGETPMFENEYRLRIADGSYKWIFTRGKVVEWQPDGRAALMLGVYTDITERKKNEIFVVRQQAALRALNEIASTPVVDAEDQLRRALVVGSRYLGLPLGMVSRIQGNQYQLKVTLGADAKDPHDSTDALANHFCEYTARMADVFAIDNIGDGEYATHPAHTKSGVESYIGVPIWLRGLAYGTLCFASDRSRHQPFDELDQDFMRLLARWVGVTLERWQHQSEQQALLDRFDKLCNELPGFLYQFEMHPDGTSCFPFSSSGIESIYGVYPEDMKSDASKFFAALHPEELGWIGQSISSSAANLTTWTATYRVLHPRLGEIWVRGLARPERLPNGGTLWHGYAQEVTEEKHAALKLQEINALRAAIFDAASIAIISTDERGIIKSFNHGAEKMLGYSALEVIDKLTPAPFHLMDEIVKRAGKLSQEFGQTIQPGFDVFVAKAREGDEDENEWTYVRKDGGHVPVILSVTALRGPDGDVTGYLGLARDISELKRIDRMKNEFISTVSHELRTPLTAINGALGIIVNGAAGAMPDTATKMLNIAHKNSLRLIHLVNDLLDMEKLVAGKMHFEMTSQLLLPIVIQSLEANAAYAAQFHVKFVLKSLVNDDLRIHTDAQRLQQVLANFLSNAAKFSPANENIDVCIERIFSNVRVSVTDKGQGIPEAFRSRIFQKFSQADSSDTRQKGGTGLGLAICKEMIERMGGKIGFISDLGKGTQFYFEMPAEEEQSSRVQSNRAQTGSRVLVVEDDPEVAELFATMLRANNYRVDICYTGQSALERLALYSYDALTIDINLPDMSGIQLIKQIRNDASTQAMPIIVISANLDDEKTAHVRDPIFHGIQWLQKPQTTDNLNAAVSAALSEPI